MSGFLEKMAENFLGGNKQQGNQNQSQGYGGGGQNYGGGQQYGGGQTYGGPPQGNYGQQQPQPPYPWVARWDDRENRTFYVNEQTGERTHQFPGGGYGGGQQGGYGGPQQGGYGGGYGGQQNQYVQEEKKKSGHGLAYGIGGAAVGLAGGALLMHEGEEMKQDWDGDKRRWENDAENFPDNAAQWTGQKVGEVEGIPQDVEQGFDRFGDRVENKWDNAVDDVEDAPEDVANWAGDKVGDVERFGDDVGRFGDNVDDAYDAGKDEGRYGNDDDY